MNLSNFDQRVVFDNARAALVKAFGDDPSVLNTAILTQSYLRFEQPLVVNQTQYTFNVLDQGSANTTNTEKRLRLQDSFVISNILICTGAPSSATDNTFLPDTYSNTQKYTAAGAQAALQAFWNAGNFSISVNNNVIVPSWDIFRHYNANQTQQTAALGAASPQDQSAGALDGWYPCEPNISLIGQKNNVLSINLLGAGLAAIQTNSRAIIILRGVLAQNVTVVS